MTSLKIGDKVIVKDIRDLATYNLNLEATISRVYKLTSRHEYDYDITLVHECALLAYKFYGVKKEWIRPISKINYND